MEKESSASESSLESSSGYGSQSGMSGATPTPEFDNGHSEGIAISNSFIPVFFSVVFPHQVVRDSRCM